MDCPGMKTLDLCSEPECLNSVIIPECLPGLEVPWHTPNHDMLKVHRILFDRDTSRVEQKARDVLGVVRNMISDLKVKKKPLPGCVRCRNVVSFPCWYCMDCTGEFP